MKKGISFILVAIMILCLSACGSKSLSLNEPTVVGTWEITIKNIQFAKNVTEYLSEKWIDPYDNLLVPNAEESSSWCLDQGEVYAVVTYTMKNIGKESVRLYNTNIWGYDGVGKFVYSDGYIFETNGSDKTPEPIVFSGRSRIDVPSDFTLDPLSSEVECRVCFVLPEEAVTNTDESLTYEITINDSGKEKTIRFEVPDRSIIE